MSMNELSTHHFNHISPCGQETHTFILNNINGSKNVPSATLNYAIFARETSETIESDVTLSKSLLPVFNNDDKWFTPTFILPIE